VYVVLPRTRNPHAGDGTRREHRSERIGQAQGSTERARLATAERATDPTMEQGLEAPASVEPTRWETVRKKAEEKGRGGKVRGERRDPRRAIGEDRSGDAGPRAPGFILEFVAVGGGKASKGGRCIAGNPVSRQEETR
jgi:hypothetical protein